MSKRKREQPGDNNASCEGQTSTLRCLIVGKTGNGKSALGNTLLGTRTFEVASGLYTTTRKTTFAETDDVIVKGFDKLKVVDTPDIQDPHFDKETEVAEWKKLMSPNPDVILLAVKCGVRYTAEEHEIYKCFQDLWNDTPFVQQHLVVVFTHGNELSKDIFDCLSILSPELKSVLRGASFRYVIAEDQNTSEKKKETVKDIMQQYWLIRQNNLTLYDCQQAREQILQVFDEISDDQDERFILKFLEDKNQDRIETAEMLMETVMPEVDEGAVANLPQPVSDQNDSARPKQPSHQVDEGAVANEPQPVSDQKGSARPKQQSHQVDTGHNDSRLVRHKGNTSKFECNSSKYGCRIL